MAVASSPIGVAGAQGPGVSKSCAGWELPCKQLLSCKHAWGLGDALKAARMDSSFWDECVHAGQ
jgi:hypothetical protein